MIPGFLERFQEEVTFNLDHDNEFASLRNLKSYFRLVDPAFPRNLLTWVGGSIFASIPNLDQFTLTNEDFDMFGLPDVLGNVYLSGDRSILEERERKRTSSIIKL
jgi:actin-related protein